MKKLVVFAVTIAGVSAMGSAAFAQDAAATEEHWEGGYIGGSFGLGAQSNDGGESVVFDTDRDGAYGDTVNTVLGANAFSPGFCNGRARGNNAGAGCRSDRDKFDYYLRAGYDTQNGNIVYGFLIEGGKNESTDSVTAFSTTPASYTFTRKLDYSLGARGRLGYAAKGALFYGTGGVTWGKIDNSFATTNGVNSFADNGKTNSWGWTAGGGVEAKVVKNFSMGVEYLYTRFTKDKYVVNVGPGVAPATNPFLLVSGGTNMRRSDPKFDTHSIRLTAAFRF